MSVLGSVAPALAGRIERRILLDWLVDPQVAADHLPVGLQPRLYEGAAVVGVCLIRLTELRPAGWPRWCGRSVEAAAHRISISDGRHGRQQAGVFVPRRDTSSVMAVPLGGRVWPGVHHRASVEVERTPERLSVGACSRDGQEAGATVDLRREQTSRSDLLRSGSRGSDPRQSDRWGTDHLHSDTRRPHVVGSTLATALADPDAMSAFHAEEVNGLSPGRHGSLESADLVVEPWEARSVPVMTAWSSWLDDPSSFPDGSAELAGALLMEDLPARWRSR